MNELVYLKNNEAVCGRAIGYKLDRMNFTYPQLVKIFAKLEFTEGEILKCMKK